MLRVRTEQNDKTKRWQWQLLDGDKHLCMSGIGGFATEENAREGAMKALGEAVSVYGEYGELYAGSRDFSD